MSVSLTLSALLLRAQIAEALVTRGDEFLARGDRGAAQTYYRRALLLDGSAQAADRIAFYGAQTADREALAYAVRVASQALRYNAADLRLLRDRGLAYGRLHRYERAADDFARAAALSHEPQDFTFAGWSAYRGGDRLRARRLWKNARTFPPAVAALRKTAGG